MKATDIRELSQADLLAKIAEVRDEYARMKLNHAVSAVESPAKITDLRKTIARMETILRELELNESK